jgi:hypothetical protein
MDLGSIEDLLRPASLAERKQRLGLLNGSNATAAVTAPLNGSPSKRPVVTGTINHRIITTDTSTATDNTVSTAAESSKFMSKLQN